MRLLQIIPTPNNSALRQATGRLLHRGNLERQALGTGSRLKRSQSHWAPRRQQLSRPVPVSARAARVRRAAVCSLGTRTTPATPASRTRTRSTSTSPAKASSGRRTKAPSPSQTQWTAARVSEARPQTTCIRTGASRARRLRASRRRRRARSTRADRSTRSTRRRQRTRNRRREGPQKTGPQAAAAGPEQAGVVRERKCAAASAANAVPQ